MPTWFNGVLRNKFTTQEIANAFDDADARLAALRALSDAAHKGRVEEAERRELTPDECWGRGVMAANGICPDCLYPTFQCECEIPFSDEREVTG